MKKMQLFVSLFLVAITTDLFAGKTVRNSGDNPNARQQYFAKIRESRTFSHPSQSQPTSSAAKTTKPGAVKGK